MLSKVDKKKLADAGMAALVAGLKGAKAILDTSSVPGASAVFSVILSCIDEAQRLEMQISILKSVLAHLDAILEILKPLDAVPESQQDQDVSYALKIAALDLARDLSAKAEVVKEKTTHNIRPAWLTRSSDEEALQDFVRTIEDALKQFQMAQGNRIERYLEIIKQQTSAIRDDVEVIKENTREIRRRGTATEKETNTILQHAQAIEDRTEVINNSTTATFQNVLSLQDEAAAARQRDWDTILRDFRRAPLARYNAERPGTTTGCSDQTRVEALQDIDKWIADPGADRVYWLRERAGYGKSAIAVSVAEHAAERGELAASFFFSHQEPDLNNASLFFPTIAFQLAQFDQGQYQELFIEAIKKFPDSASAKLNHQIEALFVKPLQQAQSPPRPLVIVVDALDECNREHAKELVDLFIPATQSLPIPIRLFITSRPEHHLITAFKRAGIPPRTIADTSREDVELYLRKELAAIPQNLDLSDISHDWISEQEIVILVKRADGLFVYASTAIRFIGDPVALNPRKRLQVLLLDDETQSSAYQPYEPLDRLYQRILDLATSKRQDLVDEVHVVLSARITINDKIVRMGIQLIAHLLAIEVSDIRRALVKLQSVVVLPETDGDNITFHHASFKDFLLDSSRSGPMYFIGPSIDYTHHRLAIRCFHIIVQTPFAEEIETAVASWDYFPSYALVRGGPKEVQYAVRMAILHAAKAPKDASFKDAFDTFFQNRALWWLEDLYLMFRAQDIINLYAWRVKEEPPPDGLIVLKAFGYLLPITTRVDPRFYRCYAFARKELRRYFRLALKYPEGSGGANTTISILHQRVRQCIGNIKIEGRDAEYDGRGRKIHAKAAVIFAEELQAILDDFMLSIGNPDEVEVNHRYTQNLRRRIRYDLLNQHVITHNEYEALEVNDPPADGAPGDVSGAVESAEEQGDLPSGL